MGERSGNLKTRRSFFGSANISGAGSTIRFFKNTVSKSLGALAEKFIYTSTRSYGAMSLAYGLLSLVFEFGRSFLTAAVTPDIPSAVIGAVFVLLGALLLIFDKPMCLFLQDFPVTDFILFDFFSIRRLNKDDKVRGIPLLLAVLLGFIPAIAGAFFSQVYVVLALALLVFVSTSFITPEFPLIFTVLIAPYLSPIPDTGIILALLSLLSFVSFAMKVAVGKRVWHFEIYDAMFIVLSLIFFVGGLVVNDVANALVMVALTLAYVPSSNLIVNRRLADCAVNALIVSSVPIALVSAVKFVISLFGGSFNGKLIFTTPDAYGAFLLISAIFSFSFALEKKHAYKKVFYYAIFAVELFNIAVTLNPGLWLAALVSIISYFIIKAHKMRKEIIILLITLPYLLFLLPEAVFDKISLIFLMEESFTEILAEWRESFAVLLDNIFFGIGFGSATPYGNTFLSLSVNFGIFAFAIIALLFLVRLVHLSAFGVYLRSSLLSLIGEAGALALVALISFGMSADVFSDITVYSIFVLIFALLSASLRIAKNEHDERISYYGDQRSPDSSDISIRFTR